MAEILRCEDRWGRTIVLHDDTWYEKILADHPSVSIDPSLIRTAVQNPDRVNFDARFPNGENFYRRGMLQHPYDVDYLKVVVRFAIVNGEQVGTIVSAYPTAHHRKAGERHKWSKSARY